MACPIPPSYLLFWGRGASLQANQACSLTSHVKVKDDMGKVRNNGKSGAHVNSNCSCLEVAVSCLRQHARIGEGEGHRKEHIGGRSRERNCSVWIQRMLYNSHVLGLEGIYLLSM